MANDSFWEDTSPAQKTFFGHPRGLATLFFTEMWERFSYYGMRGILVLYMVAMMQDGGLGLTDGVATAIYGLYTAAVYLFALPGGWLADRLIGQQKAVWYGGILISAGQFTLALATRESFIIGLVLITIGTGLLKPNVSTIVGELYPEGGARRDAGFSVFYMGINIGAFVAPLICGFLGENIDWRLGFVAAGTGMIIGLVQYRITKKHLGEHGKHPERHPDPEVQARKEKSMRMWTAVGVFIIGLVLVLGLTGILQFSPIGLAQATGVIILLMAVIYFVYIMLFGELDSVGKKRVGAIFVFFIFSTMFWAGFEQAGSSLNLFAERFTDRVIMGWEMPASWLQSVNPLLIITFAPLFGVLWVWLSKRKLEPSTPLKFSFGLLFLGLGFLVMVGAANIAAGGGKAAPTWLITTYILHTTGELCLSPVGLSMVTKLSPKKIVGQMMGVWFMSVSLGNLVAGLVAGQFNAESLQQMPDLFKITVATTIGSAILLAIFIKPIRKLMSGIH